jgi:hypothetical protein
MEFSFGHRFQLFIRLRPESPESSNFYAKPAPGCSYFLYECLLRMKRLCKAKRTSRDQVEANPLMDTDTIFAVASDAGNAP